MKTANNSLRQNSSQVFNLFVPAVFTEQYIEGMGQSQNTAVLWPNGLRLLIYWFDNMF
jgi:hypothetical protein